MRRGKRDFDNVFFMEQVGRGTNVLKDFDVPVRRMFRKSCDVHDHQVLSEPMHPWRLGDMAVEFTLRVDVEDEAAPWQQVSRTLAKSFRQSEKSAM